MIPMSFWWETKERQKNDHCDAGLIFKQGKIHLTTWHAIVTDDDLGKVLVVVVGCDSGWFQDHWYVTVVNLQLQEVDQFPCYHWIDGDSHVTITATTSKVITTNMYNTSELAVCAYSQLNRF